MFKKVLLAGALLLAPVLAYGASPSTDLSVQIVPAASPTPPSNGIACDIGPNYIGSIPAPAQAVGYTHCAANYDFTSSTTFNNGAGGSGYNFSNISTWLYCNGSGGGTASNPTGPLWYVIDTGNGVQAPCSDMSIINDGGSNSLLLTFTPTDFNIKSLLLTCKQRATLVCLIRQGHRFRMDLMLSRSTRYRNLHMIAWRLTLPRQEAVASLVGYGNMAPA